MNGSGEIFEEKIEEEIRKRKELVAEADAIVQSIEKHYQEKKLEAESMDDERIEVINNIFAAVKQKDISILDDLFERLR